VRYNKFNENWFYFNQTNEKLNKEGFKLIVSLRCRKG